MHFTRAPSSLVEFRAGRMDGFGEAWSPKPASGAATETFAAALPPHHPLSPSGGRYFCGVGQSKTAQPEALLGGLAALASGVVVFSGRYFSQNRALTLTKDKKDVGQTTPPTYQHVDVFISDDTVLTCGDIRRRPVTPSRPEGVFCVCPLPLRSSRGGGGNHESTAVCTPPLLSPPSVCHHSSSS